MKIIHPKDISIVNRRMCGIWCSYGYCPTYIMNECISNIKARGPEGSSSYKNETVSLYFTRLAINGLTDSGMQPFSYILDSENKETTVKKVTNHSIHWICNGEIYNHRDLEDRFNIELTSGSDCEIIGPMYYKLNKNLVSWARSFDGVFATILYDEEDKQLIIARDPYGVRPLYYGELSPKEDDTEHNTEDDTEHTLWRSGIPYDNQSSKSTSLQTSLIFSSEIKGLKHCKNIRAFPPGHVGKYDGKTLTLTRYHTIPFLKNPKYCLPLQPSYAQADLRFALLSAVHKRLMTERPVAALLSGGIDSSLIAAIVQKELHSLGKPPLETFSIGFEGSEDLRHARMVAEHIGSNHHEIISTPEEFFESIPQVIHNIESFDITSVRASVGNWLVAKAVKEQSDCKVVFNGDGADEIFGSYLYFYNSPSNEEFEEEIDRLLENIHHFDVLRSDRSISSHGLEPRTPFLDKQFVEVAKSIGTEYRRPIKGEQVEKWILRKAFEKDNLLPEEVLWRRKEAFSDGVSGKVKSWYQEAQERIALKNTLPSPEVLTKLYPHMTPTTLEGYYYRTIYESFYGKENTLPYFWMPRWSQTTDPSARTLAEY